MNHNTKTSREAGSDLGAAHLELPHRVATVTRQKPHVQRHYVEAIKDFNIAIRVRGRDDRGPWAQQAVSYLQIIAPGIGILPEEPHGVNERRRTEIHSKDLRVV
jgi:hypothetical protein